MEKHYYRLLNPTFEPISKVFNTNEGEMSPRMYRSVQLSKLFTLLLSFWDKSKVQLSTAFDVLLKMDVYLELLQEMSQQGKTQIPTSLFNSHETVEVVDIQDLEPLLVTYNEQFYSKGNAIQYDDLPYVWEYLWEAVRNNFYKEKKSRMLCVFLFDNIEQAQLLQNEIDPLHQNRICEIIPTEIETLDCYDAGWLDLVPVNCTFQECMTYIRNYWEGKISDKPNKEYLFSGQCEIKEI